MKKGNEKNTRLSLHHSPFTCLLLSFVSVVELSDSICPKAVDVSLGREANYSSKSLEKDSNKITGQVHGNDGMQSTGD